MLALLASLSVLSAQLTAASAQGTSAALPVSLPLSAPSSAATLNPDLLSFSIEQDLWTEWAGTTSSPNTFFQNALGNLAQRTGQTPWIRIGADSEDHTNFNAAIQGSEDLFPAPTTTVPYPEASSIVVGDNFYSLASNLPKGTRVIWGVNFGQNNLTAAFLEARSIMNAFKSSAMREADVTLEFIEIGNEADLYSNNGFRNPSTWTIQEYVKEWTNFAENVSVAAGITSGSGPKFIGAAFAGSSHSTSSFSPQGAIANGLLTSAPGKLITAISQHHYSGSFCSGNGALLQDLMTKANIRSNVSSFSPDVVAVKAQGLDYVFGETNSFSCHGAPNVSNTAGAALWTLDYTLFSSQVGISRVHFHEGVGYKYNLIQPATLTRSILDGSPLSQPLTPHVQPQYYAALIAAEAIGTTGSSTATELTIDNDFVSGYAFFEGGMLKRAVLINSQAFLSTSTGPRTAVNVDLTFTGGSAPKTVQIKRLKINHADDASGLQWAGQTFETSDAKPSGQISTQTQSATSAIELSETEVVLLAFQ
ncbi:hypothetical protein SCHPADRAFT_946632 [Schizopora paradoxa]|uniref:Beta-glucuronidase C-terminal domain-containing protein n=1 Tax=Schizopora paradoxa TaxID=27342 RepID=A0A0H2R1Y9_9AGAM|nr:hypothetical protein SCHPADRAFT_946632 [Schizopora paradoxa]